MTSASDSIATLVQAAAASATTFSLVLVIRGDHLTLDVTSGSSMSQRYRGSTSYSSSKSFDPEKANDVADVLFRSAVEMLKLHTDATPNDSPTSAAVSD